MPILVASIVGADATETVLPRVLLEHVWQRSQPRPSHLKVPDTEPGLPQRFEARCLERQVIHILYSSEKIEKRSFPIEIRDVGKYTSRGPG